MASFSSSVPSVSGDFSDIPMERLQALLHKEKMRMQKQVGKRTGQGVCTTCGKPGHEAVVCRSQLQCTKCGRSGHEVATCRQGTMKPSPVVGAKRGAGQDLRLCFKCGAAGHLMRECKSARSTERINLLSVPSASASEGRSCWRS